jgi:hypothetical protein
MLAASIGSLTRMLGNDDRWLRKEGGAKMSLKRFYGQMKYFLGG